jgi:hypothetical protein
MANKRIYIILLIIAVFGGYSHSYGQHLNSQGHISNQGKIVVRGTAKIVQDTITGQVEYDWNKEGVQQQIPQITYEIVRFKGTTPKRIVDNSRPIVSLISFETDDKVRFFIDNDSEIFAKGTVWHEGLFNPFSLDGQIRLNGSLAQNVYGKGLFKEFDLDNYSGADVINEGGFKIHTRLDLTAGKFRNDVTNNFTMADQSLIVRHMNGSLLNEPKHEGGLNVRYVGNGQLVTGPEIPADPDVLQNLGNELDSGLVLSASATFNDSLYLRSIIYTDMGDTVLSMLTSTSSSDPVFDHMDAEIDGTFRRTSLRYDNVPVIFNNPYTYALFSDEAASGGAREMTFRIKPLVRPSIIGDEKVQRYFYIAATDQFGSEITEGLNFTMGYGWRYTDRANKDETGSLKSSFESLILQKLETTTWFDIDGSNIPKKNDSLGWAWATADDIGMIGEFAIGLNGARLVLNAKVMLEGAYRYGSMAADLKNMDLIPTTPPNIYPYNLDPNRTALAISSIPDSVVDYVVLEFRKTLTDNSPKFRTCFLKRDGSVVDVDGISPVILARGGIDSGEYYIAVRHRNHLAVVTEDKIDLYPRTNGTMVDFTDESILMGPKGTNDVLKPVGFDKNGSVLFGMLAGDINGDGIIDKTDQINSWEYRDLEGYVFFDSNLSGIVNTRDLNYSWDNRQRKTFLPK